MPISMIELVRKNLKLHNVQNPKEIERIVKELKESYREGGSSYSGGFLQGSVKSKYAEKLILGLNLRKHSDLQRLKLISLLEDMVYHHYIEKQGFGLGAPMALALMNGHRQIVLNILKEWDTRSYLAEIEQDKQTRHKELEEKKIERAKIRRLAKKLITDISQK